MTTCINVDEAIPDSSSSDVVWTPYYEDASLPYAFKGTFSEAKSEAQEEAKYLVVCFYSSLYEEADSFLTNVLMADEVAAQFLERCVVFFACVETIEGDFLASKYGVHTYPSLVVLFKNEVAMELGGRLTKEIILEELKKCIQTWDIIVAEELVALSERKICRQEIDRDKERLQQLEEEDAKLLREFMKEKEQKEKEKEEQRRLKRARLEAQASLAQALEKQHRALKEREAQKAFLKEEAVRLLHPEPSLEKKEGNKKGNHNEHSSDQVSIVHLRFRFRSGEMRHRRFLRDDLADQLLYYVRTVDDTCCSGTVELSAGFPSSVLKWEPQVTTLRSLQQLSMNTIVNVRVTEAH